MIRRRIKSLVTLVAAFTVLAGSALTAGAGAAATAANSGSGNGYKVSPVRSDLTINKGSNQTVTVYVENVSNATENLQVVINDFQASTDESGNPALLLNGQNAPSHGLKRFITVPTPTFILKPGAQKGVKVVVSIPKNATAGGYYGAVRFAPANINAQNNVTLAASVASLILVKVPGDIHEQMSIASFDARSGDHARSVFTGSKNINAVVRFHNDGDVQEEPFGKVTLKDMHGHVLGAYEINNTDPRGNVLPDSTRKFSVPLSKVGSFGKYTLEGNFGYGSNGQLLSATTTFYVVPWWAIIVAIIIVALIIFLIIELPRVIKRRNRHIGRRGGRL